MKNILNISPLIFALAIFLLCQSSFANEAAKKLPYASPESQGVPTEAIVAFMEELEQNNLNMHSFMLLRNGNILAECYWSHFAADKKHRMYSVSKSFTSVAIGMMIDEGKISLDDKVADFFPEFIPENVHPYVRQAAVRNLLTMSTFNPGTASGDNDWVRAFFRDPRAKIEPGSRFSYDTSATNVLCGIVEKLNGKPILEYIRPVFDEIGISKDIWCIRSPDGRSWTGSGIMATTEDLAKFAILCMNMGEWNGKQLISQEYMKAATSRQIDGGAQGYGFQFWVLREGGFSCNGMGGQFAFCLPSKNLILVTTADNQAIGNYSNLIHEAFYRLAGKIEKDTLPENAEAQKILADKIANVSTPLPAGAKITANAVQYSGVRYTMADNPMGIKWMTVYITPEKCILVYENNTGIHSLILGMGEYIFQKFPEKYHGVQIGTDDSNFDTIAAAAWRDENTLSGMIYSIDDHLGSITLTMSFFDGKLNVTMRKVAEFFFNTYQGTAEGTAR
ncbi:MAG: beta-lactamase family protein [Planctomycetaceae bacterium]|nr:beta-lactamase family protein [Planctomycetaceae bacterium]